MQHFGILAHSVEGAALCLRTFANEGTRELGAHQQRIRATLRVALNNAISAELITHNPATLIELASGKPPKPAVWTPARVARWRATGEIPSAVMVWTPEITGEFLDFAADDELYALYHLIALRGLRRGEGCGPPWTNIDLTAAAITIDTQIIQLGWETQTSTPKSQASNHVIPIDIKTTSVLRDHDERQQRDKVLADENSHDTGLAFIGVLTTDRHLHGSTSVVADHER